MKPIILRFPHRDSRGVEIKNGQRVAYNRSGDVIEGTILDASSSGHIKVTPGEDFRASFGAPKFSRVRHGRSILVLSDIH